VAATDPNAAAIKAVIQKANQEQVSAFAKSDPTVMKDTATTSYYNQLVQINRDLSDNGVAAIKLVRLEWGPITIQSPSAAQATTFETWQTNYSDGSTDQNRDRNVYTLVQEGGAWKIQTDDHPDSDLGSGTSPTAPNPDPSAPTSPSTTTPPAPRVPGGRCGTSHNWSGYAATGGTFTSVTGTWTVPQSAGVPTPTSGSGTSTRSGRFGGNVASGATWVGIGGVNSRDLIQAGTEDTSAGSGRVHYDAWIEMLPRASHPIQLTVSPGDSITVTIGQQANDQWQIAFKNNTTGETYQTTVTYQSSLSSAEWVEEAPSAGRSVLPLDNFGTVQFTNGSATENGKTVTISGAGAKPITMIDSRGSPIATTSSLGGDGSSFTVTRVTPSASASAAPTSPSTRSRTGRGGGFGGFPGTLPNPDDPLNPLGPPVID
jgi:hypothetical protein